MTKKRLLVLDIVQNSMKHLTAKEIFELAKCQMPKITFATIYNNLNYLVDENKIQRVKIVGQPDHFDHTLTNHQHMICDVCGKVDDIMLPNYLKKISEDANVDIISYDLCIHHVCNDCLKKEKEKEKWN